ncbi:hypothetical protein ABFS82_06G195200 [Erythranthe guttata]|uniref:LOB domain-containing protein n=1 Tax=Erythranthe guttata TaxID=4155 RepID=A0A022RH94_ERYGU|nr:hypothetical protein MIMGU_mgv1a019423mg [Erythranthe guttata]
MGYSGNATTPTAAAAATSAAEKSSPTSSTSSLFSTSTTTTTTPPSHTVILSPCAACKILRRRCVEKCVLAPYFPPTEPLKFTIAHRVFGASNIIKLLQDLEEDQRADAVNSMVYEANARLRDPIYGCTGAICQLQKQISELQAELAKAQAEIFNIQCQNSNLSDIICRKMAEEQNVQEKLQQVQVAPYDNHENSIFFFDESVLGVDWEPLWT